MLKLPFIARQAGSREIVPPQTSAGSFHTSVSELVKQAGVGLEYDQASLDRFPQLGRLIILANDPLPGVSSLALLHLVSQVRSDVACIAETGNRWLTDLPDGTQLNAAQQSSEQTKHKALEHLANEGVLIIQPVHLGRSEGVPKITQERWPTDFLAIAEHSQSPLLHIHVSSSEQPYLQQARLFYRGHGLVQDFAQTLAKKFLPNVYDQRLLVGEIIDSTDYKDLPLQDKYKAKLLRKQLYRAVKGKSSYFKTLPAIATAEPRSSLLDELQHASLLGKTKDGKLIYLCSVDEGSSLLKEIGRLREQAFRLVGEGSGKACDVDAFDLYYQHIVLWDESDQEVVGAYRLRSTHDIAIDQLYTSTLMHYLPNAEPTLARGVELGRSFVQPKYWGSRSLDYLWTGIAAYIRQNSQVRYLLGAVSISNAFSQKGKDLLLGYYGKYYFSHTPIIECKRPYMMGYQAKVHNQHLFDGLDSRDAFVVLREQLGLIGHSVPTLYKQYSELCDDGGTRFHGFNIDPDFQDCIDGLVVVDLSKLKPLKRKRYELVDHDFLAFELEGAVDV